MAQPTLHFLYNTSSEDTAYLGTGGDSGNWKEMHISTSSGILPDKFIFTGGGIQIYLSTPTASYGSRDATIKPPVGKYIIPQTYVESHTDNIMYNIPLAGQTTNRYVFGVYVNGAMTSDLYLEAWDTSSFSTISGTTLSGSILYPYSMINAVSTTSGSPSVGWNGTTYSGISRSNRIAGTTRVRLKGTDSIQSETVYYNLYIDLPSDAPYFHETPVLSFRYLYV